MASSCIVSSAFFIIYDFSLDEPMGSSVYRIDGRLGATIRSLPYVLSTFGRMLEHKEYAQCACNN